MKTVEIEGNEVSEFDSRATPAATVELGEVFVMKTRNRFEKWDDRGGALAFPREAVLMTGPVLVEGVQPGDTLAVDVLEIQPGDDYGYSMSWTGFGLFTDQADSEERVKRSRQKVCIDGDDILFPVSAEPEAETIALRYVPYIGRIGVAPDGPPMDSWVVGPHGGQLGNPQLGPGSTLLLTAQVEGGLLSLQDVHAVAGEGEAAGSALEMASSVTLRCRLEDDRALGGLDPERKPLVGPMVITPDEVMTMGLGDPVDRPIDGNTPFRTVARFALEEIVHLIRARRPALGWTEAGRLTALAANLRISTIGGGGFPYGARAAIARDLVGMREDS